MVSELVRGLAPNHEIILVSPDSAASLAQSKVAQVIKGHISFEPVWNSRLRARVLAEKIAGATPDLAHFHFGGNYGWGNRVFWRCPIFYLVRKGVACISTNHGAFSILEGYCWEKRSLPVKLALLPPAWLSKQIILGGLRCEVAVSQHDWRALRRWYPAMRGKFRWIYHSRLHGVPAPVDLNRERIVLCVGTIGPRKGQTVLTEAFVRIAKKFPEWRLVFIGRGGDEGLRRIRQIVAEGHLESQVELLGSRSDEEVRGWMERSAIFAIPSVYEGLGLSLQEAQFHGCASIGTRCGGVEDLIQDGDNGLLVDVNNPDQLAKAMEKLMSDNSLREKFSRRGPESVMEKGMTAEKMLEAYERLYLKV